MICIKAKIPPEICEIDDELKAIYHSKDTVCIWVLKTRDDRNGFIDATIGMSKVEREEHFESFYD
jgi:F420-0:gamma-glutamyl ligase